MNARKDVECTQPRGKNPGAIKVELGDVYQKMQVLRAKNKLNDIKKYEKVRIRSCETHSDRVNRLNSTTLLKLVGADKNYVIVGNGVIRSKADLKEYAEQQKDSQGSEGDRS